MLLKFESFIVAWILGEIIVANLCQPLSKQSEFFASYVPAITSFSLATKYTCEAKAVWAYAWATSPVSIAFMIILSNKYSLKKFEFRVFIVLVIILALLGRACFFGLYEPYPGVGKGKWEMLYRESMIGMLTVSGFLWLALLSALFGLAALVRTLFRK